MIINIRGTNGSGKTYIAQWFLRNYTFEVKQNDGYFIPELNLFIAGEYHNAHGEFHPTGGGDQWDSDRLERVVDAMSNHHHVLFEKAAASFSFKRWTALSDKVGFYNMLFLYLNTPIEQCIKNKDSRPTSHGATTTLIDSFAKCTKCREEMYDAGYNVMHVDSSTALTLILQAVKKFNPVEGALHLSGGGKRSGTRTHGLYCSYNLEGFENVYSIRNCVERLDQFKFNFLSAHIMELGSNIGALSFEALKRGAYSAVGYEYNPERVLFSNMMADYYSLNAKFYQIDLNEEFPNATAPVVLCCAVDDYVTDVALFYKMLYEATELVLLLECNVQRGQTKDETMSLLYGAGFKQVEYLGHGAHGKVAKNRKIYKCLK